MADALETLLASAPMTKAQKADLWDAFQHAPDADALAATLKPLGVPTHIKAGLWDLKASSPAAAEFDDSGMTQEFVAPWNRAAASYPDAAGLVKGIRTNPNLRTAKLWAQIAPDGYMEVNPDLAGRKDIDAIFAHELEHARGGDETAANARERSHTTPPARTWGDTAQDVAIGFGKGAVESVSYLGDLARKIPGVAQLDKIVKPIPINVTPSNTAQSIGKGAERIAEVIAPGRAITKAGIAVAGKVAPAMTRFVGKTAATVIPRAAVEATGAAGLSAVQGGDPAIGAALGALGPAVGAVAGRTSAALHKGASKKVVQALGPTKERFKALAEKRTPEILKRGLGGSREGLQAKASELVDEVGQQIDDAITQYGSRAVSVAPIIDAIDAAKAPFVVTRTIPLRVAVASGRANVPGAKIIGDMIELPIVIDPRPVAQLDKLKTIIGQLGDEARVDQLVAIRRAWDKVVAQAGGYAHRAGGAIGVPLKDQSEAAAKRDATTAIRRLLDVEVPELSALNKEFSFWKDLDEVLTQTLKRTQPQGKGLGRIAAEGAGQVAGAAAGAPSGPAGALGGAFLVGKLANIATAVFTSPRWRFVDARTRDRLASAIESGSTGRLTSELYRLAAIQGSKVGQ